jgi:hypothetical protein
LRSHAAAIKAKASSSRLTWQQCRHAIHSALSASLGQGRPLVPQVGDKRPRHSDGVGKRRSKHLVRDARRAGISHMPLTCLLPYMLPPEQLQHYRVKEVLRTAHHAHWWPPRCVALPEEEEEPPAPQSDSQAPGGATTTNYESSKSSWKSKCRENEAALQRGGASVVSAAEACTRILDLLRGGAPVNAAASGSAIPSSKRARSLPAAVNTASAGRLLSTQPQLASQQQLPPAFEPVTHVSRVLGPGGWAAGVSRALLLAGSSVGGGGVGCNDDGALPCASLEVQQLLGRSGNGVDQRSRSEAEGWEYVTTGSSSWEAAEAVASTWVRTLAAHAQCRASDPTSYALGQAPQPLLGAPYLKLCMSC